MKTNGRTSRNCRTAIYRLTNTSTRWTISAIAASRRIAAHLRTRHRDYENVDAPSQARQARR